MPVRHWQLTFVLANVFNNDDDMSKCFDRLMAWQSVENSIDLEMEISSNSIYVCTFKWLPAATLCGPQIEYMHALYGAVYMMHCL
jgi:hypothetical protein